MSKYAFRRSAAIVLLLLLAFVSATAQEFRGSLSGNVTDPNGAALPGATVEIKNVETNSNSTATTNEQGGYSFPLLQPGKYTMTVTAVDNEYTTSSVRPMSPRNFAGRRIRMSPARISGLDPHVWKLSVTRVPSGTASSS